MYEFLKLLFSLCGCCIVGVKSGSSVAYLLYYHDKVIMIINRVVKSLSHITIPIIDSVDISSTYGFTCFYNRLGMV